MMFRATKPLVAPIVKREGKTPLHGFIKKGDVFEWITGPPYPLHCAEPVDDEARAAVAVPARAERVPASAGRMKHQEG